MCNKATNVSIYGRSKDVPVQTNTCLPSVYESLLIIDFVYRNVGKDRDVFLICIKIKGTNSETSAEVT